MLDVEDSVRPSAPDDSRVAGRLSSASDEIAAGAVATIGVGLRLVAATHMGTLIDEPIYRYAAAYTLHHGYPAIKPSIGQPLVPFLYHPPFFFYLLAGWLGLLDSTSLLAARLSSVLVGGVLLVLLYVVGRRLLGSRVALLFMLLVALDPWIILTNSALYIENGLMVLIILAVWAYWRALRTGQGDPSYLRGYVVAGLALGVAIVYKQIGGYLVLAFAINVLLTRGRDRRGHAYMFITAGAILAVYLVSMHFIFGSNFDNATITQLRRTLGLRGSPGLNYGPLTAVAAIAKTYWTFVIPIGVLLVGGFVSLVSIVRRARGRDTDDPLVLSLALGAVIFAGAIALKSPHYFILWLIPLYLLICQKAGGYLRWLTAHVGPPFSRQDFAPAAFAVLAVAIGVNLWSFQARFLNGKPDAVAAAVRYTTRHVWSGDIVAAESFIGVDLPQQYVPMRTTPRELYRERARWLVAYWSLTEPIPRKLGVLSRYCFEPKIFNGFNDHTEVCRLDPLRMIGP